LSRHDTAVLCATKSSLFVSLDYAHTSMAQPARRLSPRTMWHRNTVVGDVNFGSVSASGASIALALLLIAISCGTSILRFSMGYSASRDGLCGDLFSAVCLAIKMARRSASTAISHLASLVAAVPVDVRIGCRQVDLECLDSGARRRPHSEHLEFA